MYKVQMYEKCEYERLCKLELHLKIAAVIPDEHPGNNENKPKCI